MARRGQSRGTAHRMLDLLTMMNGLLQKVMVALLPRLLLTHSAQDGYDSWVPEDGVRYAAQSMSSTSLARPAIILLTCP